MADRHKSNPKSLRLPEALLASVTRLAAATGRSVHSTLIEAVEREGHAAELVEEALHLRMYGERAPGGDETWAEWDRKAEAFLRARLGAGPSQRVITGVKLNECHQLDMP